MTKTTVGFKTEPIVLQLIEKEAKKRGLEKSEFLTMAIMDSILPYERTRHMDTLSDFLDIALPNIVSQGIDKEIANEFLKKLRVLYNVYVRERLEPHMKLQKHLTNSAIQSYSEGENIIEQTGTQGFIVQQCLQTIYDRLLANDLISVDEWKEQSQHYRLYMDNAGQKILQQE